MSAKWDGPWLRFTDVAIYVEQTSDGRWWFSLTDHYDETHVAVEQPHGFDSEYEAKEAAEKWLRRLRDEINAAIAPA